VCVCVCDDDDNNTILYSNNNNYYNVTFRRRQVLSTLSRLYVHIISAPGFRVYIMPAVFKNVYPHAHTHTQNIKFTCPRKTVNFTPSSRAVFYYISTRPLGGVVLFMGTHLWNIITIWVYEWTTDRLATIIVASDRDETVAGPLLVGSITV